MQGDVTRIVSMSNRDRRGLIDELAGVALFDTRIEQSRRKLDDVQERQDRCRIVEQELLAARQRLEKDCAKARAYQDLRDQVQRGRQQELVLAFEAAEAELKQAQNPPTTAQRTGDPRQRDDHREGSNPVCRSSTPPNPSGERQSSRRRPTAERAG